jgi:FtsP/CotA-like multicopper oxidase with cupredoxin domain
MNNVGPDEPFGGGEPSVDFDPSDPNSTGQVMSFRVVPAIGPDPSTYPGDLKLPPLEDFSPTSTQKFAIVENESTTVKASEEDGNLVEDCEEGEPFGPTSAFLGVLDDQDFAVGLMWHEAITENPNLGDKTIWEINNTTEDAHPIHIHLVQFKV